MFRLPKNSFAVLFLRFPLDPLLSLCFITKLYKNRSNTLRQSMPTVMVCRTFTYNTRAENSFHIWTRVKPAVLVEYFHYANLCCPLAANTFFYITDFSLYIMFRWTCGVVVANSFNRRIHKLSMWLLVYRVYRSGCFVNLKFFAKFLLILSLFSFSNYFFSFSTINDGCNVLAF